MYTAGVFRNVSTVRFNPEQYPLAEVIGAVRLYSRGNDIKAYPFVESFLLELEYGVIAADLAASGLGRYFLHSES